MRLHFAQWILIGLLASSPGAAFARDGGDAASETPSSLAKPPVVSVKEAGAHDTALAPAEAASEIAIVRQMLEEQSRQYAEQRATIAELRDRLNSLESQLHGLSGESAERAETTAPASNGIAASTAATEPRSNPDEKTEASPLFFKIGRANFWPGGFLDLTSVFRSRTVGSGIATTFGTLPYSVPAGYPAAGLSEFRMSQQNSRVSLKADSRVNGWNVVGYIETDFLGYNASTMAVTSNSVTLRLRLGFADVSRGKWEILGGQDWSLMTPNRRGLQPMTNDVFYSLDCDANYQLGVVWKRQPQIRVVYHPSDTLALGISAENPQQFIGSALTLPSGFISTQADTNGATWGGNTNTPNVHPDLIAKLAYDSKLAGRSIHFDVAGIYRTFKVNTFVPATGTTPLVNVNSTASGAGGSFNANLELFHNFRFIENAYWSAGGGRYIEGLAPDFVVRPANSAGAYTISPLHSGSAVVGFEWQAQRNVTYFGYYSGVYAGRNYVSVAPNTSCGALGFCGYGFPGSSSASNRVIREATFGILRKFWESPNFGKLAVIAQASWLTRAPWSVAAGTPRDAGLVMGFATLRYILP